MYDRLYAVITVNLPRTPRKVCGDSVYIWFPQILVMRLLTLSSGPLARCSGMAIHYWPSTPLTKKRASLRPMRQEHLSAKVQLGDRSRIT